MLSFNWSAEDNASLKQWLEVSENNLRALECFSRFLNLSPNAVGQADLAELVRCGVDEETAYRMLVAAICGLDGEARPEDRILETEYFPYAIRCLDASACRDDPYYRTVRMPEVSAGSWRMGIKQIGAYEAFTSDDPLLKQGGREIPQIAYFREVFSAPAVYENGREWMTVTPSEIHTMTRHIREAVGKVAVFGLGLGYYAFMVSEKQDVSAVTVIERDPAIIRLFREHLLPQFPHAFKITVVEADAYDYAAGMGNEGFNFAYVDIWHDVRDGVEMYLRMKRLESRSPATRFLYWIEPSMLCWLRGLALQEIADGEQGPLLKAVGPVRSFTELKQKLSQEGLRELAVRLPLEAVRR